MPSATWPHEFTTSHSYLTYPVRYAVSSALRRLSADPSHTSNPSAQYPFENFSTDTASYIPPGRNTPPFQPPPLTPLTLKGYKPSTPTAAQLLSRLLAEEIRLLVPPRLQVVDDWTLVFSLAQHGASLSTLYKRADNYWGTRGGFVLVVRDGTGSIFGAYLSHPPHPSRGHYYGLGECFLWRSSILPSMPTLSFLPPLPSEDTTHAQRMTTIGSPRALRRNHFLSRPTPTSTSTSSSSSSSSTLTFHDAITPSARSSRSGTATPERIRFKAFPYSGINDYLIFCEQGFLSLGGGDGHYGLWLDGSLEKGISGPCPTFGNEPLSEEGGKFEVLGVELWYLGA